MMKKIIGVLAVLVLVITLSACGTKPTATIENFNAGRTTCKFDLKVDDKDVVTEGSVMAKFYLLDTNSDSLFTTKTMSSFDGNISVTGLTSGKEYRVDILCTYDKKQQIIYSQEFKTTVKGTEFEPVVINTAEEMVTYFSSDYDADVFYQLGADIDFSTVTDFKGFCQTSSEAFSATLDGKGYTIKNATIATDLAYNGFFGYVKGTIANVNFDNIKVNVERTTTSTTYVGIVAGYGYQAKILNVDVKNSQLTTSATAQYVGGIVGYAFGTNVIECAVSGLTLNSTKSTTTYVGGITGYICQNSNSKYGKINYSTVDGTVQITNVSNVFYGGIVGYAKVGTQITQAISNVNATVKASAQAILGGIAGYVNFGSGVTTCKDNIIDVVATGKITYQSANSSGRTRISSDVMIGGIIGSATAVQLKNVYTNVDIDVDINTSDCLFVGSIFGNGYEYHSSATKALVNCTMNFVTTDSSADAEIKIHAYDGADKALMYDCKAVKLYATKDSVEIINESELVPVSASTVTAMGWNIDVWDVTISNGKFVIKFK